MLLDGGGGTLKGMTDDERRKMKVKVEFTVETDDFGKPEFKREIEALIKDIDKNAELLTFEMYEVQS